ncbi:hypothetical protein NDU88_007508 [Pleurodeles waltl]|uniref:Uncharacterized protein n=1 Tax=Pleurodeles waltl TaxID=8319 RepID=A0AAV7RTF7_PLEWA|nr:hypothetical protein NDU88_007508 [Pleurodeles waltl]
MTLQRDEVSAGTSSRQEDRKLQEVHQRQPVSMWVPRAQQKRRTEYNVHSQQTQRLLSALDAKRLFSVESQQEEDISYF